MHDLICNVIEITVLQVVIVHDKIVAIEL